MQRRVLILIHLCTWIVLFILATQLEVISLDPLTYESGAMYILVGVSLLINTGVFYAIAMGALPPFLRKHRRRLMILLMALTIVIGASLKVLLTQSLFAAFEAEPTIFESEPIFLVFTLFTTIIYAILGGTYRFAKDWVINEAQRRALVHQKTAAELAFLKSQINPHFLFNALNNLYGLAHREKAETTAEGILKLADMMRYMLYECEEGLLPLSKELAYLRNYIDLQRLRAPGNHVRIRFDVTGEIDHLKVPPLLMVPLVENAFKHGVSAKTPSEINVQIVTHADRAELQVMNTIHKRAHQDERIGGTGLKNLRRRLRLIDPQSERLQIRQVGERFEATLDLPGVRL